MKIRAAATLLALTLAACSSPAPEASRPQAAPPAVVTLPSTLAEADRARKESGDATYEAALRAIAANAGSAEQAVAASRLAIFLQSAKRHDEAANAFAAAAALNPGIARFLGVRQLDSLAAAGRSDEALALATALAQGDDAAATDARLTIPSLHAARGDAGAVTAALAALASVPLDEFTEARYVALADALSQRGFTEAAAPIRMRLLQTYPQSRFTEKVYEQAAAAGNLAALDFAATLDLADRLGRVNRYDQALDVLQRAQSRFPTAMTGPYARYIRLRSLFNSRNYTDATAITFAEGEEYALPAELLRGRAYWRSERPGEFLAAMNAIIARAPKSKEANEARIQLSRYYISDEIDYPKAIGFLKAATAGGEYGSEGENLWNLGWINTLAGNQAEALAAFDEYLRRYPDHDYTSNVLFWSGKIHEKNGDLGRRDASLGRLIEFYPYSYYSYRARQIIGSTAPPAPAPSAKRFPVIDATVVDADPRIALARSLTAAGLQSESVRQLRLVTDAANQNDQLAFSLAQFYRQAGDPLKAMGVLQRRFRDIVRHGGHDVPAEFWEILYPYPHRDPIESAAQKQGIDELLIPSIIRQESAFNPNVVSNAGAVGLMQLMPEEAIQIAAEAGLGTITRADLFDPETNIQVGAAEIKLKLERMNRNQILAFAAYNAGEAAVGRWLAKVPIEDVDLFVESIPYAETRLYVKNVSRNYYEYQRIYEQEGPAGS
jgi:soluble lytic murein transglycosylase-like protein/outer membrane protein assembly factor BamD (BamD/ComL family)